MERSGKALIPSNPVATASYSRAAHGLHIAALALAMLRLLPVPRGVRRRPDQSCGSGFPWCGKSSGEVRDTGALLAGDGGSTLHAAGLGDSWFLDRAKRVQRNDRVVARRVRDLQVALHLGREDVPRGHALHPLGEAR